MKAPVEQQRALLDLESADSRLGRIAALLKSLPADTEVATLVAQVATARRTVAEVQSERDDADRELVRIEDDANVVRARIERDRQRRDSSTSSKEIQGFESELQALAKRLNDLDDMEIAVMERGEEIDERLAAARAEQDRLAAAHAEADARARSERERLTDEAATVRSAREAVASGIDAELLSLYERQRARYGVGAALLRRGVSEGSGVELHESDLAMIRAAAPDDVVLDPDGGCILVRTEESGL